MESDREKRVRERAYQIWQRQGEPQGRAQEHWAQAEAEIELERELAADRTAAAQKPTTEAPLRRSEPARRSEQSEKAPANNRRRGKAEST